MTTWLEDGPVTVTDASSVTLTSTFDDLGRMRTWTYLDTGVEAFGWTVKGLVASTNQIGEVTLFDDDDAHRLSTVISPAGTCTCTYKGPGNLVTNLALPNTSRITNLALRALHLKKSLPAQS